MNGRGGEGSLTLNMRESPLFSSATVHWRTPAELFASLDSEFAFDADPCPLDGSVDGLSSLFCWEGKRVFCNPPYGPRVSRWLERAAEADVAVFLLPARTDTRWFHNLVLPLASEIRFVRSRLYFGDGSGRAPFPSMIVIFDQRERADSSSRASSNRRRSGKGRAAAGESGRSKGGDRVAMAEKKLGAATKKTAATKTKSAAKSAGRKTGKPAPIPSADGISTGARSGPLAGRTTSRAKKAAPAMKTTRARKRAE